MTSESTPHEHLRGLLADFHIGMMVTHTTDGSLHARPMAIADRDVNGDLWFVTAVTSPKVQEVRLDNRGLVTLQSSTKQVTLTGMFQCVRDHTKLSALWHESFRAWFPKGLDDPSLVLMHLVTEEAEYWDNSGIRGLKYIIKAAKAYATGERPKHIGSDEHASVKLH
jgi:general stress protein 26